MTKLKSKRLLLIDDDEDDFFITKSYIDDITTYQYSLDWEPDPNKAIKKIKTSDYDLCLLDFRLGPVNGLEVLEKIKKVDDRLPVIMLTGKGNAEIDVKSMEMGAVDFLIKSNLNATLLERSMRYAIERSIHIEAIKSSHSKYRDVFLNSGDPILILNLEGEIIDFNPSSAELFGKKINDMSGLKIKERFVNIPLFEEKFNACKKGKDTSQLEMELMNEGQKLTVLCSMKLQENQNTDDHIQMLLNNISKRKTAEKLIRQAENLSLTGRLARTIAHEIRNPLTNIELSIEQLKSEVPKSEETEMFFGLIERNSRRIQDLITDLLNSSKPSELKYTKCLIEELLDEMLLFAEDRLTLNKIKLVKDFTACDAMILADKEKLKIALLNIVINAIEAMENEKGILKISCKEKGGYVFIDISDNGIGMDQDELTHLFDPFYSKKLKGTGLGLTAVYNIVTNHGGTIEVESEKGKGTCFTLCFDKE
ncbi:MAG: response regulator [Chitinophagaceae bacterium]|nr:MAG: response regulator [Chitinophagaceae bacterium]